jgi:sugar phosphate isomerase/epimerase
MLPINPRISTRIGLSRREFLSTTLLATAATAIGSATSESTAAIAEERSPVVVFSKVYQELKLNFEEASEMTAAAGLDGVDCPVRAGGEILPEHAADELPRYAEILRRRKLRVHLLTTGITQVASPFAETILRTAKKLGVQFYRLGFVSRKPEISAEQQLREIRPQLKDLAALNREIGMCALLQNHSASGSSAFLTGNLSEMVAAVEGFDPAEIGVAFDIGHALVTHGNHWRQYFERLKPHFRIAYVKDVKRPAGWVSLGQGEIAATGYFQILRDMHYHAPVSLHVEYKWAESEQARNRQTLAKALAENTRVLRGWLES